MKDKKPVNLDKRLSLKGLDAGSLKKVEAELREQLKGNNSLNNQINRTRNVWLELNTAFEGKCPHCNK